MTLDIGLMDEIFTSYTVRKVMLIQAVACGDMSDDTPPVEVYACVDGADIDGEPYIPVCIACPSDGMIPEALIKIVANFGVPDWVAIVSDTYVGDSRDGIDFDDAGHLGELFDAGDGRIREELVMVAAHANGDGLMIRREYRKEPESVFMEPTAWRGVPPEKRGGDIWGVLQRFFLARNGMQMVVSEYFTAQEN